MARLICIAHPGEASFLVKNAQKCPFPIGRLYRLADADEASSNGLQDDSRTPDTEDLLLITGEGVQGTTEKLSAALMYLNSSDNKRIDEVLNFGVAGCLTDRLQPGAMVSIRTVYGEKQGCLADQKMEYRSFSSFGVSEDFKNTNDNEQNIDFFDCVTASERVLDGVQAEILGCFAQVCDRELWAIASVCQVFGLPWRSYKLISDRAGTGPICDLVRARTVEWSRILGEFYGQFIRPLKNTSPSSDDGMKLLPDAFHLTVSQTQLAKKLLRSLASARGESLEAIEAEVFASPTVESMIQEDGRPKDKGRSLIHYLRCLVNPVMMNLDQQFSRLVAPLQQNGFSVRHAPGWETGELSLHIKLKNSVDLSRAVAGLSTFDYGKFELMVKGEELTFSRANNDPSASL